MGIIWLIIKIILWTVLACMSVFVFLCILALVAPVRYEAYLEKYDQLNYDVKVRYLRGVKGHFYLQDGIKYQEIKAFGKRLYFEKEELSLKEQEVAVIPKVVHPTTKYEQDHVKDQLKDDQVDVQKQMTKKQQATYKTVSSIKESKGTGKTVQASRMAFEESDQKENHTDSNIGLIREIVSLPYFWRLLKSICKLLKDITIYIGPKEWSFELVVGKEEPAETGELMAKLIMLYPWYYQHGIIKGNYETPGIWGGFLAEGKFCIGGILKRIIAFLWYKPVRESIKLILRKRKEEEDGE